MEQALHSPVSAAQSYPSNSILSWLVTVDHKRIGLLYFFSGLFFLILGGIEALLMRIQLFYPSNDFMSGVTFNETFTMHGTTMVFLALMPLNAAFFNYFIPLQIGARDVAFPRLNAFTYWIFLSGGLLLHFSYLINQVPDTGWTSYVNLATREYLPSLGADIWTMSIQILGLSTLVASFNFTVTIINMRAPGMTMFKVPLFTWTSLVTQVLILLSFPVVTVGLAFLTLDRTFGTGFFDPTVGGDVILWQHIFWVFGHPEVYILALPVFGYISEILATFSRKNLFGYPVMVFSASAIGFLGFGVWAHHMFTVNMGTIADAIFAAGTMTIAVPTGVKVFNWLFTMWGGSIKVTVAWLFAAGFILMFTIGGITGVMHASPPIDLQQHDSYFVVGHFHYVLIGATIMGVFGAIYYWFPKMFGRMMSEKLGFWHFILLLLGMNVTFMAFHLVGVEGMPRRYYYYTAESGWTYWNQVGTIGSFIQAFSVLIFFVNFFYSLKYGKKVEHDPWNGRGLEWSISSPPPVFNFHKIPVVKTLDDFWRRKKENPDTAFEKLDGTEKVHLPSPSWIPFVANFFLMLVPLGVLLYRAYGNFFMLAVSAVGLVIFILVSIKWALTPNE